MVLVASAVGTTVIAQIASAQTLETETARLVPRHAVEAGIAYESQTGGGGPERALPFILLYGLTDRVELAVEPVPYTYIRPEGGAAVRGPGDLEGTMTVRARDESVRMPALAVAAEIKVPTATNPLIGTGRADYTGWLIASKRFARVDTHANIAYTLTGSPAAAKLNNTWTGALAAELPTGRGFDFFAETMASTATAAESGDTPTPVGAGGVVIPPEAAGASLLGTLGAGRRISTGTLVFGSVTYDNTNATLLRVGVLARLR